MSEKHTAVSHDFDGDPMTPNEIYAEGREDERAEWLAALGWDLPPAGEGDGPWTAEAILRDFTAAKSMPERIDGATVTVSAAELAELAAMVTQAIASVRIGAKWFTREELALKLHSAARNAQYEQTRRALATNPEQSA